MSEGVASDEDVSVNELADKLAKNGFVTLYVNFDTGKSTIKPDSAETPDAAAAALKAVENLKAEVAGHTDNVGTPESNQWLSQERAHAVMAALLARGVEGDRSSAKGYGQTASVADNRTEEGRARNRRVELVKRQLPWPEDGLRFGRPAFRRALREPGPTGRNGSHRISGRGEGSTRRRPSGFRPGTSVARTGGPKPSAGWLKEEQMHTYPHPPFKIGGGHVSRGYSTSHRAKDITHRNDAPDTVYAIESGEVSDIQRGQQHGDDNPNMVIVRDSHGFLTVYGHVDPSVRGGDSVSQGDEIGTADLSGTSDGIHVHLVRLTAGDGTVDDVLDRQNSAVNFQISLAAW